MRIASNILRDPKPTVSAVYSGDLVDDILEHVGPPGFGEPDPPTQIDPPQPPPVEFEPPKDLEKHGAGPSQRRTRRFSSFDLLLAGADLDFASKHSIAEDSANKFAKISDITNTHSIGNVLYTDYIHLFQLSGMVLLVAMIGAIVLTFRKREGIRRQSYFKQLSRERNDGVSLVNVKSHQGVKIDD